MAETIMEFKEELENNEEIQQETTDIQAPDVPKKGLIAKLKELKWWQKALIGAGAATLLFVGGKWVFTLLKDKPEEVVQALENVPEIQPVKVVVPMDTTNSTDQMVQDLVNTMAETA